MNRIVEELFFLSRADLGEVKMEHLPVCLDALVEDVQRQAALLGQDREVQILLGSMTPCTVQGDELRLRELLLNLVDNALKYSKPGGKVELSLLCDGHQARLAVKDEGIGIQSDAIPAIFDRFYRTDDARAHVKGGTGLGLAICTWITEAHHGRLEVRRSPGQGSTFTVILPSTLRPF